MNDILLITADLTLFGEGGGDGSGAAAQASGDSNNPPAAPEQGQTKGEYRNVYFGKLPEGYSQTESAADSGGASETPTNAEANLEEQFKADIRGKYKDLYTKETQKMINSRFKETKTLEKKAADQQVIIDQLMQKYQITDGDTMKLQKAIDDDYNMWADAADRAGMTVDTYKEMFKIKQRNDILERENAAREAQQKADAQYQQWMAEAEEVRKTFPSFNIQEEVKNPEFARMLQAGVPVDHAYRVMHMDDIMSGVMQTTAKMTEKRVADSVRAKGNRPAENGASSQSAFTIKADVNQLTKADRQEIARRAARGEIISF